jgi:Ca-activated chloride channel family protein
MKRTALVWAAAALSGGTWLIGCESTDELGSGGSGGMFGPGSSGSAKATTGASGYYATAATTGAGSGTSGSGTPDPVLPPPPPEPTDCAELDPSQPVVLYLSADDSNSMASPARAREDITAERTPNGLRTYEFLNYYRIAYPAPPVGSLALYADGAAGAAPGEYALQIAVRSFDAPSPRRPMTLTLALDTSGSMSGHGIARERAAVKALASQLRAGDIVNAVRWDTSQTILLDNHAATGPNDAAIIALADGLDADGGTDLHTGLVKGYELAEASYDPTRLNRLVLISDGGANVGVTDEELIAEKSQLGDDEGIYLVGIGTGPSPGYMDVLMDTVTDEGRGAYVYLDSPEEAQKILGARFDEVMEVAARGVQVELTLPWYFQMEKFYGEEYSTDPSQVKPQHLAPGDAMILSQTLKACDPSIVQTSDLVGLRVTWEEPITHLSRELTLQKTLGEIVGSSSPSLQKGLAIVAYAEALKSGAVSELTAARAKVQAANPGGTDPELNEIDGLLGMMLD